MPAIVSSGSKAAWHKPSGPISANPLLWFTVWQTEGRVVIQLLSSAAVGDALGRDDVVLTLRSVVAVGVLPVVLEQTIAALRQACTSAPVVVARMALVAKQAPAATWPATLSSGSSASEQACTGARRAARPVPVMVEHTVGKMFRQSGRGGATMLGLGLVVALDAIVFAVMLNAEVDAVVAGHRAAAVKHRTMSDPGVVGRMAAVLKQVVTPASVCPATRGVMSAKQVTTGRFSAKPVRLFRALQVAGSCVRQPGVAVAVAAAVVEAAVRRVVEAVTPGHRTVARRQSTMLWPLTRLLMSTLRHTDALASIESGSSSWQVPRPLSRLSPL